MGLKIVRIFQGWPSSVNFHPDQIILKPQEVAVMKLVPKRGTIVPKMSTHPHRDNLSETLFGKTRRAVLSLLYSHIDDAFYLRQIVRAAGVGLGAVQRELKQLSNWSHLYGRPMIFFQLKQAKRSISALPCATGLSVCTLQNMSFTALIEPDTEKIFLMNLLRNLPNTMLADVVSGNYTTIGLSIGHTRKFCGQCPQNPKSCSTRSYNPPRNCRQRPQNWQ